MLQVLRSFRAFIVSIFLLWAVYLPTEGASGLREASDARILEHPEDLYVGRNEPATLTCRASGDPAPVVTWYKEGQPVTTVNDDPNVHRMLLPTGDLFFLRVARGKPGGADSDIGVYYCNVTDPETKISVVSRNASLKIAVMKDEFREEPRSTEVGVGMDASLHCKPPRGEPEPRVRWLKGDLVVQPGERISVDDQGSLRIREVRKEDAGPYVCMAYNVGGEKESTPAQLFVREKPVIVEVPKDTVAQENSDVILQCQASGDPEPDIIWRKLEGEIPAERIQILADKSLKVHNVQVADEGIYVCRLQNPFGWQEAQAVLTVHSPPSFTVTPRDKVVGVGRRVSIRCEVTGNPTPAVFWNKASSQTFMFPNKDHGRFRVTANGSLTIDNVQKEDAGEYTCQGLSTAGSAFAKVRIEVKDGDTRPPPIIHQGPQNQTLPIAGTATLSCLASGEPEPSISWMKNGVVLSSRDSRVNIRGSGSLEISELSRADTGLYTCKAASETGETTWSAALLVESTDNPFIVFHRTPEPSTFPGSPARPAVAEVTDASVRLTWKPNANQGASPVSSFSVEYFSHDTGEGWIMASDEVRDQSYVVRNLQPNTSYLFLVRARNSHGLSLPSPVTSAVRTKGNSLPHPRPTTFFDPTLVAEKLSGQVVHMLPAEVLSSTTIKLNWELRKNVMRFIEGFHVKYRVFPDLGRPDSNPGHGGGGGDYTIRTVQTPSVTTHVLSGLQKYMWYEVLMLPYYGTVEGTESNVVQFRTLEDVPSAAPKNIRASMLENDTLVVTWEPPQKQFRNGVLRGYHIYIQGNESKFDKIVDVNVSIEIVHVRNLIKDMHYHLQMAAYNRMGEGVKSELIRLRRPGSETGEPLYDQQWFRIALIVTFGVILWIIFCVLSVCIYRKRKAHCNNAKKTGIQKEEEFRSLQKSDEIVSHLPLLVDKKKETSVLPSGVGQPCMATCFHDNESPSDGDSKTNGSVFCGHTYQTLETVQNFDNHCHCNYDASMQCSSIVGGQGVASLALPYATATLVCGAPNRIHPGPGNIPNPKAYMIHQPYGCPKHGSSINTSKTESPSSTFGSDGQMPASGSGPLNQSDLCHPTCCADRKCTHLPLYNSVMYDQHDRVICGHEDCQRRAESHRLCNSPYAGGVDQSRCFTPDSVLTDSDVRDCSQTPWPSATDDDSDSNCSCVSSCGAEAESFMVNTDFVSAVNKAAEQSGLSVVGSTISPVTPDGRKVRRIHRTRHRENRPKSPYSTDSNASAMPPKQRPASKSDQTKITADQQNSVVAGGILQPDSRKSSQADDIPLKKPTAPFSLTGSARTNMNINDLAFSSNPVIGNFHHPALANTSSILNCQTNVV